MNLAQCVNPLTLRIDLAMFEPHAISLLWTRRPSEQQFSSSRHTGVKARVLEYVMALGIPVESVQVAATLRLTVLAVGNSLHYLAADGTLKRTGRYGHFLYEVAK